tara:strand:- start:3037 stop:4293 length:1257 start_codon:yes stop_codon:yes gene_type:complete
MGKNAEIVVIGAGIVGVCVAAHLQMRGKKTVLVDRERPGAGTSYGNAGLIQDEAIMPYLFPRSTTELMRYARNRSIDASYAASALPGLTKPFAHYWHNSQPDRALAIAHDRAPLIRRSVADHVDLAEKAGASQLLRSIGWTKVFRTPQRLEQGLIEAERQLADFGVSFIPMDADALADHEPCLSHPLLGGLHWPTPLSVSDPYALTMAYLDLFKNEGGVFLKGDGETLEKNGLNSWSISTERGVLQVREAVLCLGPWSPVIYKTLGYSFPFFVMRGYHQHFTIRDGGQLSHPILDGDSGYFLAPMRQGVRLTTGAEFARRDALPRPVQLERALPKARELFPYLGEAIEPEPWLGARPCMPDMLPIIGPAPRHTGLWFAFGHAHHGLTMAATTGKLIADMVTGADPIVDPAPYSAQRFA